MGVVTSKIIAGLLQMHGPDATVQSDHQGIDALLDDMRIQMSRNGSDLRAADMIGATKVYFRKAGFVRGAAGGGVFRKGAFRRV